MKYQRHFIESRKYSVVRQLGGQGQEEGGSGSNLFAFSLNPLEYGLEGALRKSSLLASILIILVSGAESLGSEVERITKWLMNAGQDISACHEDLMQELAIETPIGDEK